MEDDEEKELTQLGDLVNIEIGRRERRPMCENCSRPLRVCWCKNLSGAKLPTKCKIVILQHPHEEKRCLRTAPILEELLPIGHYLEFKGKRFNTFRFPQLKEILHDENSFLLYPGKNACNLDEMPLVSSLSSPYNILILDGTWDQAKSMLYRNTCLQRIKQVQLTGHQLSKYVIRTQPTEGALSTVETAAIALSTVENNWSIYSALIQPLKLICQFQMKYGAVCHHSKEQLILSGQYKKPFGKRTYKKLKKCGVKNENLSLPEILSLAQEKQENGTILEFNDSKNKNFYSEDPEGILENPVSPSYLPAENLYCEQSLLSQGYYSCMTTLDSIQDHTHNKKEVPKPFQKFAHLESPKIESAPSTKKTKSPNTLETLSKCTIKLPDDLNKPENDYNDLVGLNGLFISPKVHCISDVNLEKKNLKLEDR